ncbi:MAG: aminopeptidase [Saprospiraceae bacterium]
MTVKYETEHELVSNIIMEKMFQVKAGETVAITADSGSDKKMIDALAKAAAEAGGLPLVMWIPKAEQDGQAGMKFWPAEALTAALCKVDVWVEAQSIIILYSDIWETVMAENKKLRYLIIGDTKIDSMVRTFAGYDIQLLGKLLKKVMAMAKVAKKVRITSENGTDVSYETNPNYAFDYDDGDFSKPKFCTAPGYVNIVPKTGSMNGKIVFDALTNVDVFNNENHVEFEMKDGSIAAVNGNEEAEKFSNYLASFDDPNMYKISHNMFGLNPGIRKLSGDIVEDERIWGGVDFGFGHTSPIDMPPLGQVAKSHFDGVVAKTSIYLDDQLIVKDGEVCHPELKDLAIKILDEYQL